MVEIANTPRFLYLNGIRGIAALIVVLAHLVTIFYPAIYYGDFSRAHNSWESSIAFKFPFTLVYAGSFSVCIFFVLSGYVLTHSYLNKGDKTSFVALCTGRYVRLTIPIFFTSLIAYLLLKNHLFYHHKIIETTYAKELLKYYDFQPSMISLIKESLFSLFIRGQKDYNVVLWTMRIELIGSFIVYFVLRFFHKVQVRLAVSLILILLLGGHYFCFIFGMIIYDVHTNYGSFIEGSRKSKKIWRLCLGIFALLLGGAPRILLPLDDLNPTSEIYKEIYLFLIYFEKTSVFYYEKASATLLHQVGAVALIYLVRYSPTLQNMFSWKPFQFLGRISYPMYLLHYMLMLSFMSYIFNLFVLSEYTYTYNFVFIVSASIFLILTIALSYLLEVIVDRPGVKLSKVVARKTSIFQSIFSKRFRLE